MGEGIFGHTISTSKIYQMPGNKDLFKLQIF